MILIHPFDEETIDGDIINIDQYRLPYEHDEHWQIRRAFLEKNQHVLPLQKLLSLAQAYMNVKTLGCQYAPLTMKRITKYSKGIDDDYHQSRVHTLKRVLITASDAAAFKVRREDPIVSAKLNDSNVKQNLDQTDQHTTMPPAHIMNIVRNKIIILNNCLNNTMEAFNNQNTGIKMMQYSCKGSSEHCGFIKIGGFVVGKGEGITAKRALKSAADDAMIFLSKHCYSLTRKKQATKVESIAVISVEDSKSSSSTTNEYMKIGSDNVGFKMMAKFGWTGGSLGTKDNGILDPVNVEQKLGREGLGQKGKLNRNMIRQKLKDLHDGKLQDQDHLVFSNEYSKAERKLIHSLAASFGLKSQSYGSELQGNRQLVVQRNVKPLDLLRKVMIDKDPIYTEMYDVTCPTENSPQ
ncbi:uncharacterized protein LOC128724011 [Anopheles nili]|uniref:uncharacterized protein LOC128724011 n=1 Tax=Anopheles nili TaxID=185578 RepID=UPI00237B0CD8|nr:uncharacterized protein LOC128724011 [Anopheles nili]